MATQVEENPSPSSPPPSPPPPPPTEASPWYGKVFECWRNRNRVSPGRVELPDCDFFIVAPRRTLRVLRPTLKSGWYYESTIDRPESINDNFFARWSRRPHPSGNCRCSFRQSAGALAVSNEERIISAELNRIRTSLCEAEKNARDMEELEQRVSVNLQKLRDNPLAGHVDYQTSDALPTTTDRHRSFEQSAKHQIVKDLERYINTLLEEILDDTVKHVAEVEKNGVRQSKVAWQQTDVLTNKSRPDESKEEVPATRNGRGSFVDVDLSVADNKRQEWRCGGKNRGGKKQFAKVNEVNEGYVNPAFVGSTDQLASIELDRATEKHADLYLGIPAHITPENIAPERETDCVDSGINSVETIELQPDQEASFEQSLLRIIDEKLGRGPTTNNPGEDSTEEILPKAVSLAEEHSSDSDQGAAKTWSKVRETAETTAEHVIDSAGSETMEQLEDNNQVNAQTDFDKLRLEFRNNDHEPSLNGGEAPSKLGAKLKETLPIPAEATDSPIELRDYRKGWSELDGISSRGSTRRDLPDSVTFRRNRKPTIVFLHGFGSSAEIFEHQLQYFSSLGYPCIAPDMLGHGMSSAPGRSRDYHFGKLLKDLDAVLHHYAFKPGEKCVLVAHNYGCSFATALAYKYDSNVHQLVLISGGGPTPLAPPSTESAGHCCLRAILAPLLMCGLHRDILYSARGRQHPYCGQESMEQWPSHMKYVLDGMIWPEGDYVFHRRICTPTLLVHGLRDNKVSLVQECQMERTMMKAFLEAIPMAGHSPMTECPQQLNHMIHCFIDLWKNKKWQH
ncbi:Abhydrolase domain-containing protein 8 [Harpegnathos saltator]|uniref:acylglycerol lipase n=1 Tax=Harpegnathos saltator TaxID=610380 RepID=E2BWZ2_HARSA|nr:Abhydrolase domain-containing protein 8 [Harpegnathos saltator]